MNEKSLEQLIQANIEEQRKLLGVLERDRIKKKDLWDRLAAISGVLVALVGGVFTGIYSYNENQSQKQQAHIQRALEEQQNRIQEMQAFEKFLPHLFSDQEKKEKAVIIVLGELGNPVVATKIAGLIGSKGTRAGADALMSSATLRGQTQPLPGGVGAISASKPIEERWIYLGEYSSVHGSWNKRYVDFNSNINPEKLVNQVLKVNRETGTLNVREVPLGKVIDGLKPESAVKILEVKNFAGLGYMWARIE